MFLPASLEAEIARCTRCGKCRAVCPVFDQTLSETTVARGRIRLLEEALSGRMPRSRRFELYVSTCLKCLRCSSVCPASLRFDEVMAAAREQIRGTWFRYWLGRWGMGVMAPRRWLFDLTMRQVQRGGGRLRRDGDHATTRHLSLLFLAAPGSRRLINDVPPLAARTALNRWAGEPLDGRPRIGLFLGCLMNYVYTDIVEAVLELCRRRGFGVVIPKGQLCCGTPASSLGHGRLARTLARRNAEVFLAAGIDTVVAACASCSRTMKEVWPRHAGRSWQGVRVLDFSELAADADFGGTVQRNRRVTYHDPCHLKFGQGISDEPRAALRATADFVEMDGADVCCGSGGLFHLFHPDLAEKIGTIKAERIAACDAPTVVTACPACMMHLRGTLKRHGLDRRVIHLATVLAAM